MPSGRVKGSKNKITKDMKELLHLAFKRAGGVDYLVRQADAEPKAFMALLGKLVPVQVALDISVHLDLGKAMIENQANLDRLNTLILEHEPDIPIPIDAPGTAPVTSDLILNTTNDNE
jgi:hypothetical protein